MLGNSGGAHPIASAFMGHHGGRSATSPAARAPELFMIDHRSDAELLTAHRLGDATALRELMERYRVPVTTFLVRTVRDRALADEVFVDTFMALHRAAGDYDDQGAFRAWVFRIARNRAISALRRVHERTMRSATRLDEDPEVTGRPRLQLVHGGAGPERSFAAKEQLDRLEGAIGRLPENRRSALLLFHVEGLSYPEVAEVLDVPLGTVKTWIFQARKQLRAELGDQYVEEG